jgi:hypothetical protein
MKGVVQLTRRVMIMMGWEETLALPSLAYSPRRTTKVSPGIWVVRGGISAGMATILRLLYWLERQCSVVLLL